jgi:hypothetical protein
MASRTYPAPGRGSELPRIFAEMQMARGTIRTVGGAVLGLSLVGTAACDSRTKAMEQELADVKKVGDDRVEVAEAGPSHPLRDRLGPVLSKIYPLQALPRVVEADVDLESEYGYELEPGVAAVVRFRTGMGAADQVKAVLMGVAEADAWAFRSDARRDYADLIHRVKSGYGIEQRDRILKSYAHLRLLQFFNSAEAGAAIAELPDDLRGPVSALSNHYTQNKEEIWEEWMAVKMYARRVVAGDEPFRGVLRQIKKELGKEEPPPRTWEESMDAPFKGWARQIRDNEKLLVMITNMKELREREEYLSDTHSVWAMEGSSLIPAKAGKVQPDRELGFGVLREDLGGGYNELTFVFSRKLSGGALKKAYVQSVIYAHLLHDFQMLATAGSDFAKRDADNVIDSKTAVVPDEYDPLYAKCGSGAAVETLVHHYGNVFPVLSDLRGSGQAEQILDRAHRCVIDGARGDIHIPAKDNDKDVEGPAPGSRLALYQMLARFENIDVSAMMNDDPTPEDEVIDDAEAVLKRIKAQENEGKGVK